MNLFKKSVNVLLMLLIFSIFLNIASASDNVTVDDSIESDFLCEEIDLNSPVSDNASSKAGTQIQVEEMDSYYKEKNQLVGYFKDQNGTPIENKTLNIFLNGKTYNKTTDSNGKVTLPVDLKPNEYNASVKFLGDDAFNPSEYSTLIKIEKAPLKVKISSFNTYENSDNFFKAKVYNKITNSSMAGIRITFKVYSQKTKKCTYYHATTNKNGIASLNRNLKVGSYKISARIKDAENEKYISYEDSKNQVSMKVKSAPGEGCCSFYVQINNKESVSGFRRDSIVPVDIYIKSVDWHGRTAVKQYKTAYSYFFHSIVTSDGWMISNGGLESATQSKSIENLAGDMVKSNNIKKSDLNKIQKYKKKLKYGHFSIKAPDGRFAIVWKDKIITGKLKSGQYFCSPNDAKYYRHGTYKKFDKSPVRAAIKIGATDDFGENRRDITVFHWKSKNSKSFKTSSWVGVHASNDGGKLVGRSTAHLKDNIYFMGTFINNTTLPVSTKSKFLGNHKFGNIDVLVKTPTAIKAPNITSQFKASKYFKITVRNNNTGKVVKGIKISVKVVSTNSSRTFTVKTDSKGVAKINTKSLKAGNYTVIIGPANNKYLISAKCKISILQ